MKKTYLLALLLLAALISLSVDVLFAQNLVRGPYLQSSGPESIIVCWRTDVPADSRVYYGNTFGSLSQYVDGDTVTTEHRVKLTGLSPRAKYFYSVGTSSQTFRSDPLLHFTSAPDPENPAPVRLWAIGDFGHGNVWQAKVRDAYLDLAAAERPADLWIWLGDNVYDDGTDEEYQTKVFEGPYGYPDIFPNLPFFPTSGNHDYNSICPWQSPTGLPVLCNQHPDEHEGPYLDMIEPPAQGELGGVPSNRKLFYSYDYGDIHFVSLNSELGSFNSEFNWTGVLDTSSNFTSPMLEWLKEDLAATDKKWKIVYWHQCPYSGQNDFTEASSFQVFCIATRMHFNPILEEYGVDLVLTGHDHNYQRTYLINGHYGYKNTFMPEMLVNATSGNDAVGEAYIKYTDGPMAGVGTVYVVQGNSSGSNSPSPIEHPVIYWGQACDTCCGSLIVDIEGDRLDARYLTGYGEILDQFTILKQSTTGISGLSDFQEHPEIAPNPFYKQTAISFSLLQTSSVRIDVLELSGKVVHSILPAVREPGNYRETLDFEKAGLSKGIYIVRLELNGISQYFKAVKAG